MLSTLIKRNFQNSQKILPSQIVDFTHLYMKELGFYFIEVIDPQTAQWRVEVRFIHPRNDIYGEIIIDKDTISPHTTLNQSQLQEKCEYLINLYKQYKK